MNINRIIFWEPVLSPHKFDFLSELVKINPSIEIICCANADLGSDRLSQGWILSPKDEFKFITLHEQIEIKNLILENLENTFHVFSGIRWFANIKIALFYVRKYHLKFSIMSEPRVVNDILGPIRYIHSIITEGWIRNNVSLVFAQGANAPSWFQMALYPKEIIIPFAYFIKPPIFIKPFYTDSRIQVGYVGRLVKMKGINYLIEGVNLIKDKVDLKIAGNGPILNNLKYFCRSLGLKAEFSGVIPMNTIGSYMSSLDVLVLPSISNDDGWGVVVSEALMCGTAVIATDAVGASVVLEDPIFGIRVPIKAPNDIASAILKLKKSGLFSTEIRLRRKELAISRLSARAGATHFYSILKWAFNGEQKPTEFYRN